MLFTKSRRGKGMDVRAKSLQSCPILWDPMDCSLSRSKHKSSCDVVVTVLFFSSYCTIRLKMFSLFFCVCFICIICVKSSSNLLQYSTIWLIVFVGYLGCVGLTNKLRMHSHLELIRMHGTYCIVFGEGLKEGWASYKWRWCGGWKWDRGRAGLQSTAGLGGAANIHLGFSVN